MREKKNITKHNNTYINVRMRENICGGGGSVLIKQSW